MEGNVEGNEAPKVNSKTISPDVPSAESKELQQKAAELAKATREKGMGMLRGKFPIRLLPPRTWMIDFTYIGHFMQGESGLGDLMWFLPEQIVNRSHKLDHRQVWSVNKYVPPMEKKKIDKVEIEGKRFGILPKRVLKKELVDTNIPKTYHGKKGESDWVQLGYYMPTHHKYDDRASISVEMFVAVPPDIAAKIEEQVAKNVYFPDAFVKALYPGYIGPDNETHIKRIPSTELQIVDRREGKEKSEVRPYPQPIPY